MQQTNNLRVLGLLLLILLHWTTPRFVQAQNEVKLTARLQQQSVPLNREATLIVEAKWKGKPDEISVFPLDPPTMTNLKVVGTATANQVGTENGVMVTTRRYEFSLRPETLGMAYVDETRARYHDASGQEYALQTSRLSLQVVDPVPEPGETDLLPFALAGVILVVITAGVVFFLQYRKSKRAAAEAAATQQARSLEEEYAERLRNEVDLKASDLVTQYANLSTILRQYLRDSLALSESIGTTEELLQKMVTTQFAVNGQPHVQEILQACDVVKFSGASADPNHLARLFTLTEELLRAQVKAGDTEAQN